MLKLPVFRLVALIYVTGAGLGLAPAAAEPGAAPLARSSQDPAEQTAPASINLRPGGNPISPYEARVMYQELDNLVGRFETALIMASSADQPAQLTVGAEAATLVASRTGEISRRKELSDSTLIAAQQLLTEWSDLIGQGRYTEARQRWAATRQTLWQQFPVDQPIAQPEVRAIWLDRGTLVRARSARGLEQIFDRLAAAGINTVFLETVNAGYPIYPSQVAPQQNPLTRHWDPLAAAVELGHARNIEVHAWVWTFAAGNQVHNRLLNLPESYLGPVLNAHPAWAGYDNRGNPIPLGQTKPFLDPANPEVRTYLMRLLSEIVANYDVDGIQLDYIRYPFQDPAANRTYGYGLAARQQFRRLTGTDPLSLSPNADPTLPDFEQRRQRYLWNQWTEFRRQQVTSFVAEASQMLRRQKPDLVVSVAVFSQPTHERLLKIQQDWETWAKQGYVDWVVLMSYALDTSRFEELIRPWVQEEDFGATLIIPGIRLLNLSVMAAFDQIQSLRDLPTSGYALFAAENFEQGIETVLNTTQGPAAYLRSQPIPQQQPFTAAAERYQILQREWKWLLDNQQLEMEDRRLQQWATEVNALGQQLDELAQDPSHRKLAQVRSRLNRLRTSLNSGMTLRTASNAYRQRAWQSRLTTIEHLLAYGEERVL